MSAESEVERNANRQPFVRRIRELRASRGWNQDYLAQLSGLGKIYISQLENGHKQASITSIEALAQSFKITIAEFLKGV